MMADDTQDDLSMEDILSSIKDILDNEAPTAPASAAPVAEVSVAAAPVAPEPRPVSTEDDVYDLSKSMIIEDPLNGMDFGDDTDSILDLGLDDFDTNLDNINIETTVVEEDSIGFDMPNIRDVDFEPLDIADSRDATPLFEVNDVESEPIFSPEDEASANDLTSLSDDTPAIEDFMINRTFSEDADSSISFDDLETPTPAPTIAPSAAVPDFAAKAAPVATPATIPFVAPAPVRPEPPKPSFQMPASEPKVEIMSAPRYEPQVEVKAEPKIEASPTVAEIKSDDMADVSAGIINNFAKIFASSQEEHAKVAAPVNVEKTGNISQTIEDVVKSVIREIIGDSVKAELEKNIDINTFAKEEIKTQTKTWLEAKLPSIVEASVQKEIERVMAKVGG